MDRDQATELARQCARNKPESYFSEPFQPHEWVVDAILQASSLSAQVRVRVTDEDVRHYKQLHTEGMRLYNEAENAAGRSPDLGDSVDAGTKYALESFSARLSQGSTHDASSFICYLIDNCEKEVIYEESLHEWFADFLKNPRYAQSAQGEAVAEVDELDCETGPGTPCITMLGPMPPAGTKLYTHPAERAAVPDVVLELLRDLSVYRSSTYTEVINAFGNRAKAILEAFAAAPQPPEGARVVDAKTPFDANPLARPIEDFLSEFRKRYSSSRGRGIKANAPMQDIVAPLAEAWNQYLLSWPQKLAAPTLAGKEGAK